MINLFLLSLIFYFILHLLVYRIFKNDINNFKILFAISIFLFFFLKLNHDDLYSKLYILQIVYFFSYFLIFPGIKNFGPSLHFIDLIKNKNLTNKQHKKQFLKKKVVFQRFQLNIKSGFISVRNNKIKLTLKGFFFYFFYFNLIKIFKL
jgi:hypothetical protein